MANSNMKAVEVGVCYPWRSECGPSLEEDTLWKQMKALLEPTCNSAAKAIKNNFTDSPEYPVKLRRVRASAGRLLLPSILECIDGKDIIIAHLAKGGSEPANPNVCFELGYAYGKDKRVFLTTRTNRVEDKRIVPSDLEGFYVTTINKKVGSGFDRSLQTSLRHAIVQAFMEKNKIDVDELKTKPKKAIATAETKPHRKKSKNKTTKKIEGAIK